MPSALVISTSPGALRPIYRFFGLDWGKICKANPLIIKVTSKMPVNIIERFIHEVKQRFHEVKPNETKIFVLSSGSFVDIVFLPKKGKVAVIKR